MKCPFCNAEIKEGSLYCESCGQDIHIVPDYDPILEAAKNTVTNMSYDIFNDGKKSDESSDTNSSMPIEGTKEFKDVNADVPGANSNNDTISDKLLKLPKPVNYALIGAAFLLILLVTVLSFVFFTSDSYKLGKADQALSSGDYDKAVLLYEGLIAGGSEDTDLLIKYSNALYGQGDFDRYIDTLLSVYDNPYTEESKKNEALDAIISYYDSKEMYEKITELFNKIGDDSLKEKYSKYFVDAPVISTKEGVYELPQLLVIEGPLNEKIMYRYTCTKEDDTETIEDTEYTTSVLLEDGLYEITAYCVNEYGIKSDPVNATVEIKVLPPIAPEIDPASGEYTEPKLIEISNYIEGDFAYYYTIDGSEPTTLSPVYTEPIVMTPGISNYKFVCANKNGVLSEIVSVKYNFNIEYSLDTITAHDTLCNYLYQTGLTVGPSGQLENGGVIELELKFIDMEVTDENTSYSYIFEEYIYNESGLFTSLDSYYSVDVLTGAVKKYDK
ncbi:MAG: chitobiase/beta-hexosaminidase C-terminal domain-containing protein [Lachnospiraceae bacterium]|nr:chitobiase/beta-hexosaminidase C-terminal domain-containing protein [Lachnospiraceae bacterium]